MAKVKAQQESGIDTKLEKELAEHGLKGFFQRIPQRVDMDVECVSTGYPKLDMAIHPVLLGIPRKRHVEIYSKIPSVGKTSIALDILREWQKLGLTSAIVDIEDTITMDYLVEQRVSLDEANTALPVPYLAKGYDTESGEIYSAEQILDNVRAAAKIFDLVIVDSLPGLARKSELEKEANDAAQPGGIGKLLFEHVRKTADKKATIIWINQARVQIGGYNPTGQVRYKTAGGDAIPFFGSLRLELTLDKKLTETVKGQEVVYGLKINIYTAKNKIAPPYRTTSLTYIYGEGFSMLWDYYELGKQLGVISKEGSWVKFGELKAQGELNFYRMLKASNESSEALVTAVNEQLKEE